MEKCCGTRFRPVSTRQIRNTANIENSNRTFVYALMRGKSANPNLAKLDRVCTMVRSYWSTSAGDCRGGLGRAGTKRRRLLVELGMEATKAIGSVQAVRLGAIRDQ
jgi:hypothetical protein